MIRIKLDPKELLDACIDAKEEAIKDVTSRFSSLAKTAPGHLAQLVKSELNSHHAMLFIGGEDSKNIDFKSESPIAHILTIKDTAVLIDNGEKIDMKTDKWLFKNPNTKTGKNGKYLVVPFEHGSNPKGQNLSTSAKFERGLTGRIKEELDLENKKRKANNQPRITLSGIERFPVGHAKAGQIKEGLLHEFNVFGSKKNPNWSENPLTRLKVYQSIKKDKDGNPILNKKGQANAARTWLTFRTASEGKPDKFWYPEPKTKNFLERTGEWVEQEFYEKIIPELITKWKG